MRKFTRATTVALFSLLAIGATGCSGSNKNARGIIDLNLWTGFGSQYTGHLSKLIDYEWENKKLNIEHDGKGGYDGLQKAINATLNTGDFPNIANGYPDHFATYANNDALVDLKPYLDAYKAEKGVDLLDDYYSEYMTENKEIKEGQILGLPFNKSTELMGYNGVFVDFAHYYDTTLPKDSITGKPIVPSTWQEWVTAGPKYRAVQEYLCGKVLHGTKNDEGTASNFSVDTNNTGSDVLIDFTEVQPNTCRVLSWDAADNMFITIVRDWGSEYTKLVTSSGKTKKGQAVFATAENKPKTIEAMTFFNQLYKANVFGLPQNFGESYSSAAFEHNQVMFMICSTGGLGYNINLGQRFRCAPIPYYDDGATQRRFVISQGTNLAIFDQVSPNKKNSYDETLQLAFDTLVDFTTGDLQAQWAMDTGYFPASKSASENNAAYQAFLASNDYSDPVATAYREGSKVNADYYMKKNANKADDWEKFVDPGFDGSSKIRSVVKNVMATVFEYAPDGKSYEQILNEICSQISQYLPQ